MKKAVTAVIILFAYVSLSFASVNIAINGTHHVYPETPRLSEVLNPVAATAQWYWPAAQLFKLDNSAIDASREDLIELLRAKMSSDESLSLEYQSLIMQLQSWHLADRVQITIDFDLARFSLAHNPRFEAGEYILSLVKRPSTIDVFGAVTKQLTLTYTENQCTKDILSNIAVLPNADANQVILVLPTGKIQRVPVAYWNQECVVPMPGSSIYIPLQENQWFEEASLINQKMTSLAINRIPAL